MNAEEAVPLVLWGRWGGGQGAGLGEGCSRGPPAVLPEEAVFKPTGRMGVGGSSGPRCGGRQAGK